MSLSLAFYLLSLMTVFFLGVVYQYLENLRRIRFKILRSKPPSIELAVLRRYTENRRNGVTILPSIETPLFSPRRPAAPVEMPVSVPLGGYLLMFSAAAVVPFGVVVAMVLGLAIGYLVFRSDLHDREGAVAVIAAVWSSFSPRHGPTFHHHPRDPLPPPKFLENKLAVQATEMLRITRENQRLKETNVALRQELFERVHTQVARIEQAKTYNNWNEKYINFLHRPTSKWNENQLGRTLMLGRCPPRRIGCCVEFSTKGTRRR